MAAEPIATVTAQVEAANNVAAGTPAEEAGLPPVPQAPTLESEQAAYEKAMATAFGRGYMPKGATAPKGAHRLKAEADKPTPNGAEDAANGVVAKPKDGDQTNGKPPVNGAPKPAKPVQTHDEQQAKLSSGFSRLNKLERRADQRENALAARAAQVKLAEAAAAQALADLQARQAAWEAENAPRLEAAKVLDADEYTLFQAYAKRKGETAVSAFNRLVKRMANEGKLDPEDVAAAAMKEVEGLKATISAKDQAEKERNEAAEKARQAAEDAKASDAQRAIATAAEKRNFKTIVAAIAENHPELSAVVAAGQPIAGLDGTLKDPVEVAYELATDLMARSAAAGKPMPGGVPIAKVAEHMEAMLRNQKIIAAHDEAEAAKAAGTSPDDDEDPEPEPKPRHAASAGGLSAKGNGAVKTAKPEAALQGRVDKPKNGLAPRTELPEPTTLTNRLAGERSGAGRREPRNDAERLNNSVDYWNSISPPR